MYNPTIAKRNKKEKKNVSGDLYYKLKIKLKQSQY